MIEERVGYMVDSQQSKGYRVLSIFDRLMDGQGINKKQEALTHQVGEKTIQRDIDEIRTYLRKAKLNCRLQYVRTEKVYKLIQTDHNRLSKEQVLVIIKILIQSRAFSKSELNELLEKLISIVAADQDAQILLKEKSVEVDVQHNQSLVPFIWSISEAIQKNKVMTVDYVAEGECISTEKMVKPLAVIFSAPYFYVLADNQDSPTVYRMDRIQHLREQDKTFQIGELHKDQPLIDVSEPIRFLYKGKYPQTVFNRFPTAKLVSQNDHAYLFEANVFGNDINRWFLSQGADLEILEPIELREEMIETIQAMQQNYHCI